MKVVEGDFFFLLPRREDRPYNKKERTTVVWGKVIKHGRTAKLGRDFFDMASLLNGLKLNRSKHFIGSEMREIEVDPGVIEYIKKSGKDFRVSTDCSGPVILPTELKPPKDTDLQVKAGKNTLFISSVQARYINRVTMDMLYDPSRRLNCYLYDEI